MPTRPITALGVVWIVLSVAMVGPDAIRRAGEGAGGYATARWRASALASALGERENGSPIHSNAPDACWALEGLRARYVPWRPRARSGEPPEIEGREWPSERFLLAWFDRVERPYLLTPAELRRWYRLRVVATVADGTIYEGRRRTTPTTVRTDLGASSTSGFETAQAAEARPSLGRSWRATTSSHE